MITSPAFVLCVSFLFAGIMAQATVQTFSSRLQNSNFVSANTGGSLTLQCVFKEEDLRTIHWFKQTLGQKPQLMATQYVVMKNYTFYDEFRNSQRFVLEYEPGQLRLKMTDLSRSDTGSYYCARKAFLTDEFTSGTFVSVEDSHATLPALVHQSTSGSIQSGDSVTLSCTVHTGTCDGEHSVYWFKHSEESHPGLIYTHGGRNDQCERKDNTHTHTCVYNLPLKDLKVSHAGTYYCAVASCGHILFGNGTKLDIRDKVDMVVYFLSGALTFTTLLAVLLAVSVCRLKSRSSNPESRGYSASYTASTEIHRDATEPQYAALRVTSGSRRQRDNTNNDCVYSRVKH
ncbi:uncharacterized protein V6R79_011837 [Siganus canaliculatus]